MAKSRNVVLNLKKTINEIHYLQGFRNYSCAKTIKCTSNQISFSNVPRDSNFLLTFRFNQTTTIKCWKCGVEKKSIKELFCDKCNIIQEPYVKDNYFKVFDIKEEFDVDQQNLTKKYRSLQSMLHPDKFTNKSTDEKAISEKYSALVNKAYNTLQTPLGRALHMLHIKGENIYEDQKVTDTNFLMEIMQLNEQVEAAVSPDELKRLNETNKKMLAHLSRQISDHFAKDDIEKAKENIIKMKYFNSVHLHINGLLRERGIVE